MSAQPAADRGLPRRFLVRALVFMVLAAALCLGVLTLFAAMTEIDLAALSGQPLVVPALLLQIVATLLFILAWHLLLARQSRLTYSFAESSTHIGITLTSKYLPGKVWGLLGRALLLEQRGETRAGAASLLLTDQLLTFYSGSALILLALLAWWSPPAAAAAALLVAALTPLLLRSSQPLLTWLATRVGKLGRATPAATKLDRSRFTALLPALLVYLLHWLCTAGVLLFLFYPLLSEALWQNALLLVAAVPAGLLAGFLALWAPGGVGVREAVIVAVLSLNLSLEVGMAIAVSYRFLCILNDLATGGFAFQYLFRRPLPLPGEETEPNP